MLKSVKNTPPDLSTLVNNVGGCIFVSTKQTNNDDMGYRINERNIGDHTLEGGIKRRRTAKAKLSEQEIELAKAILQRVYDCLQFDKNLSEHGHLHDDSVWTDGGRFIISLTGKQKDDLFDIIHEKKF